MAFRDLPLRITDPTHVENANYKYVQVRGTGSDLTLYADAISANGVYLYEVRVAGRNGGAVATFKRTFTVLADGAVSLLDVSSDYTNRPDSTWTVTVTVELNSILIKVSSNATAHWIASITKTYFT
jgi:hypothetical protein